MHLKKTEKKLDHRSIFIFKFKKITYTGLFWIFFFGFLLGLTWLANHRFQSETMFREPHLFSYLMNGNKFKGIIKSFWFLAIKIGAFMAFFSLWFFLQNYLNVIQTSKKNKKFLRHKNLDDRRKIFVFCTGQASEHFFFVNFSFFFFCQYLPKINLFLLNDRWWWLLIAIIDYSNKCIQQVCKYSSFFCLFVCFVYENVNNNNNRILIWLLMKETKKNHVRCLDAKMFCSCCCLLINSNQADGNLW